MYSGAKSERRWRRRTVVVEAREAEARCESLCIVKEGKMR